MFMFISSDYLTSLEVNVGLIKNGLSLKIKKDIHLYFLAAQHLCNYALLEDIDN